MKPRCLIFLVIPCHSSYPCTKSWSDRVLTATRAVARVCSAPLIVGACGERCNNNRHFQDRFRKANMNKHKWTTEPNSMN